MALFGRIAVGEYEGLFGHEGDCEGEDIYPRLRVTIGRIPPSLRYGGILKVAATRPLGAGLVGDFGNYNSTFREAKTFRSAAGKNSSPSPCGA